MGDDQWLRLDLDDVQLILKGGLVGHVSAFVLLRYGSLPKVAAYVILELLQ